MNNQFDELTKSLAQSVTRRAALKKFGVGLVGMALACFGLANKAEAAKRRCAGDADCHRGEVCCNGYCEPGIPDWCDTTTNGCCCGDGQHKRDRCHSYLPSCNPNSFDCANFCYLYYC